MHILVKKCTLLSLWMVRALGRRTAVKPANTLFTYSESAKRLGYTS